MKRVALCVGVNRYDDKAFNSLTYSVSDAVSLKDEFKRHEFEAFQLSDPLNQQLLSEVELHTKGLGPGDVFVFFFAGHGYTGPGDQHLLLCRDDRLMLLRHNRAGVPVDFLEDITNEGGYNRVFLLDACRTDIYSGKTERGGTRDLALVKLPDATKHPGTCCVLRSCDRFCPALEYEELGHGVFTQAVLALLQDPEGRALRMGTEFYDGVRKRMVSLLHPGDEQKPHLAINGESFCLFEEGLWIPHTATTTLPVSPTSNIVPSPHAPPELFLLRREIEEALRKIGRNGQPPEEEELLAKAKYRFDAGNDAFEQKQYPPAVELFKQAKELLKERRAAIEARRKAEEDAKRAAVAAAKAAAAAKKAAEEKAAREAAQLKAAQERAEKEAREKAAKKAAREKAAKELAEKKAAEAKAAREKAEREKAEREAKAAAARAAAGLEEGKVAGATTTIALGHGEEMLMVWCPKGTFEMGSPSEEQRRDVDEELHPVTLTRGFWMSKYPVTQRQWKAVMGTNPSVYEGDSKPVENVTWEECREFCRRAGKGLRLPTEAEWEYACRAGSKGEYSGSGLLENMGWYASNTGGNESMFVGRKNPNAWGLNDMHGNVWEWCADAYDKQYGDDGTWHATDPTGGTDTSRRVIRGGSWRSKMYQCRSAYRMTMDPEIRDEETGFRVCCFANGKLAQPEVGGHKPQKGNERPAAGAKEEAAARGRTAAEWYGKGEAAYYGRGAVKDYAEAAKCYRKAAELGHADSQYSLGFMLRTEQGVRKDLAEAAKWYRMAAAQGHVAAQVDLYKMFLNEQVVPRDDSEAAKWAKCAAGKGDAEAQYSLGEMYLNGQGVPQSDTEARKWSRAAAMQGNCSGQFRYAWMLANGRGGAKDETEAAEWYQKAVDQGSSAAMNNLGVLYRNGGGVPKNATRAAVLFLDAAEKGNAVAQYNIGTMYEAGEGVPQSREVAEEWYEKAAAQGDESAKKKLQELRTATQNPRTGNGRETPERRTNTPPEKAGSNVGLWGRLFGGGERAAGETKRIRLRGGEEMEMVWCPAGTFMMGTPSGDESGYNDEAAHRVTLSKGFWMGKYPVTQEQWKAVMGTDPSHWRGPAGLPVDSVSWVDCRKFCETAGGGLRLPTEAEWEYACRAGSDGRYGGTGRMDDMGWYAGNSGKEPHLVGRKRGNAWGLHDMHGNVWEWCEDVYKTYPAGHVRNPVATSADRSAKRVRRGGAWNSDARDTRSARRDEYNPQGGGQTCGFRVCCDGE